LKILKTSVPLGVIGMIYETRPNVTVDAATLCLKRATPHPARRQGNIRTNICRPPDAQALKACGMMKTSYS
jgi:hypothetical protein